MNAALLLEHYAQIADAPDAIARLRRFILDLAVRGKLVEHGGDGSFTQSPDAPYPIPSNWRWRRIGDELELLNGMAFKPTDWVPSGLPIVRIQNLNNPLAPFNYCDPAKARDRSLIDDGAFLISWSGTPGTSFGAFIWQRGSAVLNQHIFRCDFKTTNFDPAFLQLAINGRLDEMIAKAHGGVGLQHITKGKLEAMLIALPPLPEQHRVVAKVNELMALCNQLETAQAEREMGRDKLTLSTLAKLNEPDPETFADDARFALEHLEPLTKRTDQIKQLRQTILNLAVRGKLVAQDLNDEPAYSETTIEHAEDEPFAIPASWRWRSLRSLGTLRGGGTPAKSRDDFWNGRIPWVSPKDMKVDYIVSAQMAITDVAVSGSAVSIIDAGSIMFVVRGMILAHSFPVAISKVPLTINQDMKALTPEVPEIAEYLLRALKGLKPEMLKRVQRSSHGTCRLEGSDYADFPVPIPPLAEQHRIVSKVDELMALCDQLEASLVKGEQTRSKLLEAVLHEALEPPLTRP